MYCYIFFAQAIGNLSILTNYFNFTTFSWQVFLLLLANYFNGWILVNAAFERTLLARVPMKGIVVIRILVVAEAMKLKLMLTILSYAGFLLNFLLNVLQFLEDISPLIQEASLVRTNWRGVAGFFYAVWRVLTETSMSSCISESLGPLMGCWLNRPIMWVARARWAQVWIIVKVSGEGTQHGIVGGRWVMS